MLDGLDAKRCEEAERIGLRCFRRRRKQEDSKVGTVDSEHVAVQRQADLRVLDGLVRLVQSSYLVAVPQGGDVGRSRAQGGDDLGNPGIVRAGSAPYMGFMTVGPGMSRSPRTPMILTAVRGCGLGLLSAISATALPGFDLPGRREGPGRFEGDGMNYLGLSYGTYRGPPMPSCSPARSRPWSWTATSPQPCGPGTTIRTPR